MKVVAVALLLVLARTAAATPFVASEPVVDVPQSFSRLSVAARLESDPTREDLPLVVSGTISYVIPRKPGQISTSNSVCFFLPYNDPRQDQATNASRRFEYLAAKTGRQRQLGGSTSVNEKLNEISSDFLTPYLMKVTTSSQEIQLEFKSHVPRPSSYSRDDFMFEGFNPVPLHSCPEAPYDSAYFQVASNELSASVYFPSGWQYIGPGTTTGSTAQIRLRARLFGFVLAKGMKVKVVREDDPRVKVWYRSEQAADLDESISHALDVQQKIFGKFPFPSLDLVETGEVEKASLPGLITLNRPKQEILRFLQSEWLNWRQWLVTAFTANQWYGQSVSVNTPDDGWLLDGLADYATQETLITSKLRYNLFNTYRIGFHIFSFNYLQIQELVASALNRAAPSTRLTSASFNSFDEVRNAHPLAYIKHALALRQMKFHVGDHAFSNWLKQVTRDFQYQSISPSKFMQTLGNSPSPFSADQKSELTHYLSQWWSSDGWPDLVLRKVESTQLPDGKWAAKAQISQKGAIKVPAKVLFLDSAGNESIALMASQENTEASSTDLTAAVVLNSKATSVVLDPNHEVFDSDRFDNKSTWSSLKFFPGNARTLDDDNYTLVWAPYAFRHPGEPTSVGVQGVLFKYLQGSTRMRVETYPKNGRGAGFIHQISDFPDKKLNFQLLLQQYYTQDQVAQFSVLRSPLFFSSPLLNLGAKIRYRNNIDAPESSHVTGAAYSSLKTISSWKRLASARIAFESEYAPKSQIKKFGYVRDSVTADATFTLSRRSLIDASLRLFHGKLAAVDNAPSSAKFRLTSLEESRLRIDDSNLPLADEISSGNAELSFPLFIPLPWNSLVLSRNIRWRTFYDHGYSPDLTSTFKAGGLGLDIPFGGDIMGAGSLTFTRLSILAVLYTSVNQQVSRKPSFLFDVTGEL